MTLVCSFAVVAVGLGGCAPGWQGRTPIRASNLGPGLTSALPADTPIPAVVAAARDVLSERGLVVTEASATLDQGRVLARPGYEGMWREMTVTVRRDWKTVSVHIAGGVESYRSGIPMQRDILERMLTRLGL